MNWTWSIGPVKQPNSIEFGFQTLDLQRFKTRSGSRRTVRHKDPFGRIKGKSKLFNEGFIENNVHGQSNSLPVQAFEFFRQFLGQATLLAQRTVRGSSTEFRSETVKKS